MLNNTNIVLVICFVLLIQIMSIIGDKTDKNRITTPADFTGYVTHIKLHKNGSGNYSILAESHANKLVHRCLIEVTDKTTFFILDGETYQPSNPKKLKLKDQIQVWFYHPTNNSIREYGKAKQVVISTLTNHKD